MKILRAGFACAALAFAAGVAAQVAGATSGAAAASPARAPISSCIGCHAIPGYQSSFPQVYRVPKIAGQSARYIESALLAYRNGERNHPTMTAVAQGLSEGEIRSVAAHFAALGRTQP